MPSIFDIAPLQAAKDTISVRGIDLDIHGLMARDIAVLLKRFPELRKIIAGTELSTDDAMMLGIDMLPAVIAAGLVEKGGDSDAVEEHVKASIEMNDQAVIFNRIMELTRPDGVPRPLARAARNRARSGKGTATTSRRRSRS